jgi:hypothetical protein
VRLRDPAGTVAERSVEIADASLTTVVLPVANTSRHRLELELDDDPVWRCSWRTRARPAATPKPGAFIDSRRRARWWTVSSRRAAEFVILGPTSVSIESRAITSAGPDGQPTALVASISDVAGDDAEVGSLALDGRPERAVITERRRKFQVAHANEHTLLLTEARPYRVRVASDRGRVLIRVRARRDRGDIPPPAQVSIRELEVDEAAPPPDADARVIGPGARVRAIDMPGPIRNRAGTFDAVVVVGLDEIGEADIYRVRFGTIAKLGWRREHIDNTLWTRVAAQTAVRERSPVAAGGLVELGARIPVAGLRLVAGLDALAHRFAGRTEASLRAGGFIDRPTWVGRRVQLVPRVRLAYRWQSLSPARLAAAASGGLEPHPRVYLDYIEHHPFVIQPELGLRTYPLRDLALWTRASMIPNSDVRSVDHVNLDVGLDGVGRQPSPWVPTWGLSYRASLRFADAERDAFFVRHRVDADLGVTVWADDLVRCGLVVRNQVYVSSAAPVRDVIEIWLRIDAALGRRLRDYLPGEQWFGELLAPRGWGGDDQHQARSTRGRVREAGPSSP